MKSGAFVGRPAIDFDLSDANAQLNQPQPNRTDGASASVDGTDRAGRKTLSDFRNQWLFLVFHRHLA